MTLSSTHAAAGKPHAEAIAATAEQPPLGLLLLIFWGAFAGAVAATSFLNPGMFVHQDPDSIMRLVQVRDLLGGQGWFDLVQHRLDPPDGVLMHWSRLIDAPLAGLMLLGDILGHGESFALAAWPLLLLLGFMGSALAVSTALAGRAAAVPTLLLSLVFLDPMLSFLPGSIDHHNAQLVLLVAAIAAMLRRQEEAWFGAAAGLLCGLSLAIGLELLPFVAALGLIAALRWGWSGEGGHGTMAFGLAFGASPALLHLAQGSPVAAMACDALSFAYATPAAVAGFGLAASAFLLRRCSSRTTRLSALALVGCATAATVLAVAPECLAGPYGALSPELKRVWLSTISEAQPLLAYAAAEPAATFALVGPPILALAVALRRASLTRDDARPAWLLPALVIGLGLGFSLYQVRTLPVASSLTIPVLGAWLGELIRTHGFILKPLRRALPVAAAALCAIPLTYLAVGAAAVAALSLASGGRIAPVERAQAPEQLVAGLSEAEKDCLDPASAEALSALPAGLILTPVFYGPAALAFSPHSVVAGPYHRSEQAILDAIQAMDLPPEGAARIIQRRGADYLAICSTSQEVALAMAEAPGGLLARLLAGQRLPWLEPVPAARATALRLWRVRA